MRRRKYILAGLVLFGLFLLPAASYADCSCTPSGGSILQGVEYVAKSCPTYQAKIEECKGEWLLLSFDFSTCEGECVNANNGPPMCPQ